MTNKTTKPFIAGLGPKQDERRLRRNQITGRLTPKHVERLVRAAARRDQRAWDGLVNEFGGMIWAIARAHRLGENDAADVFQATWLRLLEHLGDLNEPARVGAWLATTARRECLRRLRIAQRYLPYGDDAPQHPAIDAPLDARLLAAERDRALWRSFARLRQTDQALLRLLMVESPLAYEEISAALGMPIGSIGPTRARALARLRRELEKDDAISLLAA
jgi:RNA polymerase sigma factor (sigma-70 family)